jgi:hypothetical protein
MPSITTKIVEKIKQTQQDTVTMEKNYSSSVGLEMKEALQKAKEQKQ